MKVAEQSSNRRRDAVESRRRGFTLLECALVIGLIAILASIVLAAVSAARRQARKATSLAEVKNMETAWRQYYAEYQKWPSFALEGERVPVLDDAALILQGQDDAATNNPRKIQFLLFQRYMLLTNQSVPDLSRPISPYADSKVVNTACFYYVKFDTDYDDAVAGTGIEGDPPFETVKRPVIVWTFNPDVPTDDESYVIGSWR